MGYRRLMGHASTRSLLEAAGYEIRFRENEWVECLIFREREAWIGQGLDQDAALEDALDKACPSHVARQLLNDALERSPETEPSNVQVSVGFQRSNDGGSVIPMAGPEPSGRTMWTIPPTVVVGS